MIFTRKSQEKDISGPSATYPDLECDNFEKGQKSEKSPFENPYT